MFLIDEHAPSKNYTGYRGTDTLHTTGPEAEEERAAAEEVVAVAAEGEAAEPAMAPKVKSD